MPTVWIWLTIIDKYEWQSDEIELGIWIRKDTPDEIEVRGDENGWENIMILNMYVVFTSVWRIDTASVASNHDILIQIIASLWHIRESVKYIGVDMYE